MDFRDNFLAGFPIYKNWLLATFSKISKSLVIRRSEIVESCYFYKKIKKQPLKWQFWWLSKSAICLNILVRGQSEKFYFVKFGG